MCSENIYKKSHYPNRSQIVRELIWKLLTLETLLNVPGWDSEWMGVEDKMGTGMLLLLRRPQLYSLDEGTWGNSSVAYNRRKIKTKTGNKCLTIRGLFKWLILCSYKYNIAWLLKIMSWKNICFLEKCDIVLSKKETYKRKIAFGLWKLSSTYKNAKCMHSKLWLSLDGEVKTFF